MEQNTSGAGINNPQPRSVGGARPADPSKIKSVRSKEKEEKSSGAGVILMVVAIVALCCVVGFLLFRDQEKNKIIMAKQENIDTLNILVEKQIADLEAKKQELTELKSLADELQIKADSLPILIMEIEQLQKDLRSARGNARVYKSKYETYLQKVASIESEILRLNEEKDLAMARIDTLTSEKLVMGDTIRVIKQEKAILAEKVAIASIMKGQDFSVSGYTSKGKEYAGPQFKNKQLAKLKFVFNLAENKVAPQNEKYIVMRLIEPDGTVLFSGTEGGSFTTADGEEKMYSMSQSISFSGSKQKVTFMYQKGNEYKSGKHTIEVYADGHKIGDATFTVK